MVTHEEDDAIRRLGKAALNQLRAEGPDALERINDLTIIACELGLGRTNDDASEDTHPWLLPLETLADDCEGASC